MREANVYKKKLAGYFPKGLEQSNENPQKVILERHRDFGDKKGELGVRIHDEFIFQESISTDPLVNIGMWQLQSIQREYQIEGAPGYFSVQDLRVELSYYEGRFYRARMYWDENANGPQWRVMESLPQSREKRDLAQLMRHAQGLDSYLPGEKGISITAANNQKNIPISVSFFTRYEHPERGKSIQLNEHFSLNTTGEHFVRTYRDRAIFPYGRLKDVTQINVSKVQQALQGIFSLL